MLVILTIGSPILLLSVRRREDGKYYPSSISNILQHSIVFIISRARYQTSQSMETQKKPFKTATVSTLENHVFLRVT